MNRMEIGLLVFSIVNLLSAGVNTHFESYGIAVCNFGVFLFCLLSLLLTK